jgi:regulator of protease activity HflC (stomatin/prohibitin superfamily)
VIFDRIQGIRPEVRSEGLHFRIPYFQWPTMYEVRTQFENMATVTGTKDLQTVDISLRILYRPQVDQLPRIHSKLGPNYARAVLPSIANEVLKAVVVWMAASGVLSRISPGSEV